MPVGSLKVAAPGVNARVLNLSVPFTNQEVAAADL